MFTSVVFTSVGKKQLSTNLCSLSMQSSLLSTCDRERLETITSSPFLLIRFEWLSWRHAFSASVSLRRRKLNKSVKA